MLSSTRPLTSIDNIDLNMLWDGLFDAFDWVLTVVGIALLWQAGKQNVFCSPKTFIGSLLIGAGLFNIVEGLINHHFLGNHHVKPGINQLSWDIGFLSLGVLMAIVGWLLLQNEKQPAQTQK